MQNGCTSNYSQSEAVEALAFGTSFHPLSVVLSLTYLPLKTRGCGQGILRPTHDSKPNSYLARSKHVKSDDPS